MKKLGEVIAWIDKADNHYVDIGLIGENEPFIRALNKLKAMDLKGSVEGYFLSLANEGKNDIWVNYFTKTKSGWNQRRGPIFGKVENKEQGSLVTPQHSPNGATSKAALYQGLGTPADLVGQEGNVGLYNHIVHDTRNKLKQTEDELKELQEKHNALLQDNSIEEKRIEQRQTWINMANDYGPTVAPILMGLFKNTPQMPLNAPAENHSETKQALLNTLKKENVDDRLCQILYVTSSTIQRGNQEFLNQLTELINKHNG